MRTHTLTPRCATAAIAAALALGSTPLLAQAISPTGEPVILDPAPAAPPPVVEAPAPVTTTAPVVQSLPPGYVPATDAAPAAAPSAAPSTAATRSAAPVRAPAASAPSMADAAPVAAPVADAAPPATDTQLFPPSETAVQENDTATATEIPEGALDDLTLVAGIVGALALLGFGGLAVSMRRRHKRDRQAMAPKVTRPVVKPREEPVVHTYATPEVREIPMPVAPAAQPVAAEPAIARAESAFGAGHARWADDVRPRRTRPVQGALPSNGASVDLPARVPDNYEDREALFSRMVLARPDKANPFTDRKARMKRARLILQSLGVSFADRDPWIDLSQYPNNWPELARRRYPQAA